MIDVLGSAAATTKVGVGEGTGALIPADRQGGWFHTQVPLDNTAAARHPTLRIVGAQPGAGPDGKDRVGQIDKAAFLPKNPETFAYDEAGNLLSDGRWDYAWDAENRLIAQETRAELAVQFPELKKRCEYVYDSAGRRIRKQVKTWTAGVWETASDRRFVYDGWNLLAEIDWNATTASSAVVTAWVWGLDLSGTPQGAGGVGGLLVLADYATGATYNYAYDGNGNVTGLVDTGTGAVAARYDYTAFGETILLEGAAAAANPFRFSTKYADAESGLYYYGLRYYNPSTGRWLSRDRIGEVGGVNLYGFGWNDAVNTWDILGLLPPGSALRGDTPVLLEVMTELDRQAVQQVIRESASLAAKEAAKEAARQAALRAAAAAAASAAAVTPGDTQAPPKEKECGCVMRRVSASGGDPYHNAYAASLQGGVSSELLVIAQIGGRSISARFDAAVPFDSPKIVYEAKTKHEFAYAPDGSIMPALDSLALQFVNEQAVATACKMRFIIAVDNQRGADALRSKFSLFDIRYIPFGN